MAIRGRIPQKVKDEIVEMAGREISTEKIAEKTGASEKQVESIVAAFLAEENSEGEEEQAEAAEESETDMADFWKQKYFSAHETLVLNGLA